MKTVSLPDFMWTDLIRLIQEREIASDSHGRKLYSETKYEIEQQTGLTSS